LGDEEYLNIFRLLLLPIVREFKPDLTFISAGFDCAQGDPLGGMEVSSEAFAHLTRLLMDSMPHQRVVMALEGGYNVRAVSEAVVSCVGALLGDVLPPLPDSSAFLGKREQTKLRERRELFLTDLRSYIVEQQKHWKCLRGVELPGAPPAHASVPAGAEASAGATPSTSPPAAAATQAAPAAAAAIVIRPETQSHVRAATPTNVTVAAPATQVHATHATVAHSDVHAQR
jgi:histone deacetylase 6